MKLKTMLASSLLTLSTVIYASHETTPNPLHWAIQGAISTNGNLGIGLANYHETNEIGLLLSAKKNNRGTEFVVPALFAGFRTALSAYTYFAYGIDLASKVGRDNHESIDANVQVGPYVSLEQTLTKQLLLVGWIEPYSFEYEKIGGSSTTTQKLFGSGGIGLSYFFA